MEKRSIRNYFIEASLIIFSVLFALFINKLAENAKTNTRKKVAIESIKKELYRNSDIIDHWIKKHVDMRDKLNAILEGRNDSLKNAFHDYPYLNIDLLTNGTGIMDAFLTNTAWETAQSTQILSEFDFQLIQQLTYTYSMQETITEHTMLNIINFYYSTESHQMENLDTTLMQLLLRFWELTAQEELLKQFYQEALKQLE